MSNPERGEVWLVDLGYVAKVRPYSKYHHYPPRKAFEKIGGFELGTARASRERVAILVGV